jgi:hypothetical protein
VPPGTRGSPGPPGPGPVVPEGGTMSAAVTMQDLELEHAELLPSRETLNACCGRCGCGFIKVEVDIDVGICL